MASDECRDDTSTGSSPQRPVTLTFCILTIRVEVFLGHSFRQLIFAVVIVMILLAQLQAQNPRGSLRGAVQDATGARVAGAKIVLRIERFVVGAGRR